MPAAAMGESANLDVPRAFAQVPSHTFVSNPTAYYSPMLAPATNAAQSAGAAPFQGTTEVTAEPTTAMPQPVAEEAGSANEGYAMLAADQSGEPTLQVESTPAQQTEESASDLEDNPAGAAEEEEVFYACIHT
jgi:hypothetical protein